MTPGWYRFSAPLSGEALESLRRLEARHDVRREITDAVRWARLYGGALALMVLRGEEDRLEEPLDMDLLLPDCFRGLLVLDRAQGIRPSMELVSDLDDPDFGLPESYTVDLDLEKCRTAVLHHSRVLRFVGRELPRMETVREDYWGASEMEHIYDELLKRSAASANIAQLLFQANVTTLKMSDYGDMLGDGTEEQRRNVEYAMGMENRFRTSFGIQLLSRDDSLENHTYSFTGLGEIYEQFMMDMAGAAEIPATKLFGRSPQGMNATGESDLRNYYDMIASLQERLLRPALEKLLPVMAVSCWGIVPRDL
jgi:phage-related protein (TIGR01555 family)